LGGALFATKIGSVYPQSFSFIVSINILSLIIIGGMGSIPGVFIGGLALVGLPLLLSQFTDFRYLIYGAALVFMMLVKPEGLSPEARRRLELHEEKTEVPLEEPASVLNAPGELGGK
jgi:branched-chain amino acid transport system permease protein